MTACELIVCISLQAAAVLAAGCQGSGLLASSSGHKQLAADLLWCPR